ncbi:SPOR domain-containing protein [Photobacterium toruni]|uniref:SPOR domain-containing protein n=1 Tax=Photobacterium toruni TaxID=1935446 RepID=A0ABU6L270_9GAMM|nr:SPOR domain-containing protein [Photobacterium toruni]
MKKIITLSLLSSLVGCAQLMPPKTPLQVPIETISSTTSTETFVEPTVVAELDPSVKTEPLYQSIDSIAVSEQVIEDKPTATVENSTESAVNTDTDVNAITADPTVNTIIDVNAITADPTVNTIIDVNAITEEPTVNAIHEIDAAAIESVINAATNADNETTVPTAVPTAVVAASDETAIDAPESIVLSNDITVDDQTTVDTQAAVNEPIATESTANTPIADNGYQTVDMHGYSVQVTASRDEQSLVTLLSLLDSQQPAWLNKKMINGSQVYTLLLGHYSDHEQAKAALALLPEALQQNGAFVRNFYDIEHTGSPQLKQLQ